MVCYFTIDIPVTVDQQRYDVCHVKSTNTQYYLDTKAALDGILEMEFGFRDSFPVLVASLCQYYANIYKCGLQKAVWFGAGVGRGPFCLSQTFDNVSDLVEDISVSFKLLTM